MKVCRQCPRNTFEKQSPCSGFFWRDDLSPSPWGPMPSPPSTPQKARRVATPCISARCSSAHKPRGAHQSCSQAFCKDCCLSTSLQCKVLTHNKSSGGSSTLPAVVPAQSYARMIAPEYGIKITQNAFAISPSSRIQSEAYRIAAKHTITVKYCTEVRSRSILSPFSDYTSRTTNASSSSLSRLQTFRISTPSTANP